MKPLDPPPPDYAFAYRNPPQSGNVINGLGETQRRQARHVFHGSGRQPIAWEALDVFFTVNNCWATIWQFMRNRWALRHGDGAVAETRRSVDDPKGMTQEILALAKRHGASVAGVATVTDEDVYAGQRARHGTAICIGVPMDRGEMAHAPQPRASIEVMRAYAQAARISVAVARDIRAMGWPARAYADPNSTEILHIPLAVRAGLGQLGKHGSLICLEHGSNLRLAAVLTDLPLAETGAVDIGVDDLCAGCRRCTLDCPADAISDAKQWVRGVEKWYVDFDRCAPYFTLTNGCSICIQVCPWSEPGRGPLLSAKLLAKRVPAAE